MTMIKKTLVKVSPAPSWSWAGPSDVVSLPPINGNAKSLLNMRILNMSIFLPQVSPRNERLRNQILALRILRFFIIKKSNLSQT